MDPLCQQRDELVHALGGDESCMMPHPRQLCHQEDAEAMGKEFGSWACPRSSHGEVMWGEELLLVTFPRRASWILFKLVLCEIGTQLKRRKSKKMSRRWPGPWWCHPGGQAT